MHDLKKKIIKGFAWEGGTKIIVQVLSWMSTVIVARLLTPEDYGIVAVSGVFILLLSIFADLGLTAGLINKEELSDKEITGVFWFGLLSAIGLSLIVVLISPFVETLFKMPGLADLMMVSSIMLIFASVRFVPAAKVMRAMNFKYQAIADMSGQFVMITLTISLAYQGYGPWSLILGTVAMHFVITIIYVPHMKGIGYYALHWDEIRHITHYGAKVMVSRMLSYLTRSTPTFFAGILLGQKSVGQFSLAEQIGKIPLDKIGVIFNKVIFPATSRIKDNPEYSSQLFLKLHKILFMISSPMLVGLAVVSEDLVLLLFTEKWSAIIPLLQLVSILNLLIVSSMIMPPVLEGMGKPEIVVRYNIMTLILLPVATVIGLQWGLVEMIVSWFFVYPVSYGYLLFKLSAVLNFKVVDFFMSIRSILISTMTMLLVLLLAAHLLKDFSSILRLIVMIFTGALVYAGILYMLSKEELYEFKRMLKQMRS